MQMFKTGLVSVSFRRYSPEEILSRMQEVGLRFIEWGSDVHAPADDAKMLARLSALQRQFGIQCCSYGTYFRIGQENPQEILKYIRAASILHRRKKYNFWTTANVSRTSLKNRESCYVLNATTTR